MNSDYNKKQCCEELRQAKIELELKNERIGQLENLMNHNPDTGLLQRHILTRRINLLIGQGAEPFAFGILRMDRNYQRIRHTRDRLKVLLYVTVERLQSITGKENLYQSDRSDEFLFLLPRIHDKGEVEEIIQRMITRVEEHHNPPASDLSFSCNVGVALYPDHGKSLDELEVNSEIALGIYEEKKWNGFLYSQEIGKGYHRSQSLEDDLRKSILNNFEGFHLVYQPIVDVHRDVVACEALLRWDSPRYGSVRPDVFIPLAENNGMINYLGKWVLYKALGQVKIWREKEGVHIEMSVNISPIQIEQQDFVEMVETALEVLKVPGKALHLELTERAVVANPDETIEKLETLQKLDIEIMLDDFGTGYSSLSALNNYPIDTLKIDKSFVDNLPESEKSVEMAKIILDIARTFGFTTLAEGIEERDQFDFLVNQGCQYIQGYITSPPIPAAEFEERFLN